MARCEECIHGEVCVRFAGARTLLCGDKADERCKYFKSTAEVLPKSEVDKTIAEWAYLHADVLNKLENAKSEVDRLNAVMKDMDDQRAYTINMLGENLENAKSEV